MKSKGKNIYNKVRSILSDHRFVNIISVICIIYSIFFLFLGDMVNRSVSMVGAERMILFFFWCFFAIIAISSGLFSLMRKYKYNNKTARVFIYISIVALTLTFFIKTSETNQLQETFHVWSAIAFSFFSLTALYMLLIHLSIIHKKYILYLILLIIVTIASIIYVIVLAPIFNGFAETVPLIVILIIMIRINLYKKT